MENDPLVALGIMLVGLLLILRRRRLNARVRQHDSVLTDAQYEIKFLIKCIFNKNDTTILFIFIQKSIKKNIVIMIIPVKTND